MRCVFIIFFFFFYAGASFAQSDLLILKKNNRKIESFYPGSEIDFSTQERYFEAYITTIKSDSVFLVQYNIQHILTTIGVYVLDTVSEYHFAINYHEIISIGKKRNGFDWNASGAALFGGGTLLTTAGLVTWIFSKPNTRYYARPALVIGAAALAVIGYILMKSGNKKMVLGKKYRLNYIKMT
jgi:hypothetical protein